MAEATNPEKAATDPDSETLFKMYSLLVEMADRVSQRRQAANSFYLSVNTALIGASAFLSSATPNRVLWVLGFAGVAICVLWVRNIVSYKTLNLAKFGVIQSLEKQLPAKPYTEEWVLLDPELSGVRHKPFHKTEILVPFVFMAVHVVQALYNLPWTWIIERFCSKA